MQTRIKINRILLIVLCCFTGLNVFAEGASTELEQILRPCIDEKTFAVAHLNVEKLDLDAFVELALKLVNEYSEPDVSKHLQDNLKRFQSQIGEELNNLLKAGGRDIFLVFSMDDFPYFFVAIPITSADGQDELLRQIQKIAKEFNVGDVEIHVSNRLILAGLKQTITRLKTISPMRSRALAAGFEACTDTTVQVVLFPSSDQRRILSEMLPKIPSESGDIRLTFLSKDMNWAALGFNGPPSISLDVTVQSSNTEGADRVLTVIKNLYALVGQNQQAKEFMPKLNQVLERLTPRRQGRHLLLRIEPALADLIINDFVAPALMEVNSKATRFSCGSNMSNIGRGLLIYANDHDDKFPPDLETLISKAEMSAKDLVCPATMDSYIYRGATISVADIPSLIMVYEKLSNHANGRNVLFLDSHVEWVSEERFQELIQKDNKYRREKGFPELPAE